MASRSLEVLKTVRVSGGVVTRMVEDGGVVRMKILVKRQKLEQVLEQVTKKRDANKENHCNANNIRKLSRSLASKSLESGFEYAKEMKNVKFDQEKGDCRSYWRPALQSIPEEF